MVDGVKMRMVIISDQVWYGMAMVTLIMIMIMKMAEMIMNSDLLFVDHKNSVMRIGWRE
jgi:hypothetical protein